MIPVSISLESIPVSIPQVSKSSLGVACTHRGGGNRKCSFKGEYIVLQCIHSTVQDITVEMSGNRRSLFDMIWNIGSDSEEKLKQ